MAEIPNKVQCVDGVNELKRQQDETYPGTMDVNFTGLLDNTFSFDRRLHETSNILVHYLSTHLLSNYDWNDMENLMKILVILCETISVYGDHILPHSNDAEWFLRNSFKSIYIDEMNSNHFITATKNILKSTNSIKSGILLDNILSHVEKCLNYNISLDALSHKIGNEKVNRKKMHIIIERIFVLPCSNIENAIETIIRTVRFEILGYIFCEPTTSIYFEKCIIVGDVICNKIINSAKSIKNFFIPSLLLVLESRNGKTLYKECLKNKNFCSSLNISLKNYINNLQNSLHQKNYLKDWQMSFIIYMRSNKMHSSDLDILKEFDAKDNKFLQKYLTDLNITFI